MATDQERRAKLLSLRDAVVSFFETTNVGAAAKGHPWMSAFKKVRTNDYLAESLLEELSELLDFIPLVVEGDDAELVVAVEEEMVESTPLPEPTQPRMTIPTPAKQQEKAQPARAADKPVPVAAKSPAVIARPQPAPVVKAAPVATKPAVAKPASSPVARPAAARPAKPDISPLPSRSAPARLSPLPSRPAPAPAPASTGMAAPRQPAPTVASKQPAPVPARAARPAPPRRDTQFEDLETMINAPIEMLDDVTSPVMLPPEPAPRKRR